MRLPSKIAALICLAAVIAMAAYASSIVIIHRDPTLLFLRSEGLGRKANLVPAIFPTNTPRSAIAAHFGERGFLPMRLPQGEHYADEGWSLMNLLWHYDVYLNYDAEGQVAAAWGSAYRPFTK